MAYGSATVTDAASTPVMTVGVSGAAGYVATVSLNAQFTDGFQTLSCSLYAKEGVSSTLLQSALVSPNNGNSPVLAGTSLSSTYAPLAVANPVTFEVDCLDIPPLHMASAPIFLFSGSNTMTVLGTSGIQP